MKNNRCCELAGCACVEVFTYSFVAGLIVVVTSRQVPHGRDQEASTFSRIRVLLVAIVTEAPKQAADDFLIVADEIGILTDVVTVPDGQEGYDLSPPFQFVVWPIQKW